MPKPSITNRIATAGATATSALASVFRRHGPVSTVDTARAAPPPSPLQPIDLHDPAQVYAVMSIAACIGDILLSSGSANHDTFAQIRAVTSAYGLMYCHIAITMNTITLSAHVRGTQTIDVPSPQDAKHTTSPATNPAKLNPAIPVNVFRVSRQMTTDFSKLAEVDRLIRSIQAGATPPVIAEKVLDELEARPRGYGFKTAIWGWSLLGGSAAILLGGNWFVAVIAFFTSFLIIGTNEVLARRDLPAFFLQVLGGIIATLPTAVIYQAASHLGFQIRPGLIIASCIIVLVAGLSLVQSLQDAVTGAAVTGSARFFDTLLMTSGIVAGVAIGMKGANRIGIHLPAMEAVAPPNFNEAVVLIIASGFVCAGFAIGSYGERSAVFVLGGICFGGVGHAGGNGLSRRILPIGWRDRNSIGIGSIRTGYWPGRRTSRPPLPGPAPHHGRGRHHPVASGHDALSRDVCAAQRADPYWLHKSVPGARGRGCPGVRRGAW